jgi:hypothetical protein
MVLVCLFHGVGTGVVTLCYFSTVSVRRCVPDDGRMWRPKHVELETFQEKRILYIQLDSNKTYVTKMYGTTNIKSIAVNNRFLLAVFKQGAESVELKQTLCWFTSSFVS